MVNIKNLLNENNNTIKFLFRGFLFTFIFLTLLDISKIINLNLLISYKAIFIACVFCICVLLFLFFEEEKKKKYTEIFKKLLIIGTLITAIGFFDIEFFKNIQIYIAILTVACGFFVIYFNFEKIKEDFFKEYNEDENDLKALKLFSYIIPFLIIGTVFYINYLPFGFQEKITLDVGNPNDTEGKIFLEGDLGPRQKVDGEYFRYINGPAYLIYEPDSPLENTTVKLTWEGEGLTYPKMPDLDFAWDYEWDINNVGDDFIVETKKFDLEDFKEREPIEIKNEEGEIIQDFTKPFMISFEWEIEKEKTLLDGDISLKQDLQYITLSSESFLNRYTLKDFSKEEEKIAEITFDGDDLFFYIDGEEQGDWGFKNKIEILNINNGFFKNYDQKDFEKRIEEKDGCIYFKNTRLEIPNSTNQFEEGPWVVYMEWIPETTDDSHQQLLGHFNWEIYQNKEQIQFNAGRMKLDNQMTSLISEIQKESPVKKRHSLLALYQPNTEYKRHSSESQGHITLFLNEELIGKRDFLNNSIREDYSQNLSMGHTRHGYGNDLQPFYSGSICNVKFAYRKLNLQSINSFEKSLDENGKMKLLLPTGKLDKLHIEIKK